jgi:hypothetical protein
MSLKIIIEDYCDGFRITLKDRECDLEYDVYIDQEDSHKGLKEMFKVLCPEAKVTYKEVC